MARHGTFQVIVNGDSANELIAPEYRGALIGTEREARHAARLTVARVQAHEMMEDCKAFLNDEQDGRRPQWRQWSRTSGGADHIIARFEVLPDNVVTLKWYKRD